MGASAAEPGRSCTGCGKPLSRYNTGKRCQACISAGRKDNPGQSGENGGNLVDGVKLAQLRHERGWTQDMLAGCAGLSAVMVQKLEQNVRRTARISTLSALARVLDVPVGVLLGDKLVGETARAMARQAHDAGPYRPTLLRALIAERHWQRFQTFEAQFRRAARELAEREGEPDLAKLTVSSRQWERWYAGNVKTEPYPDACRVLEHMFGYPVQQLLATQESGNGHPKAASLIGQGDDDEVMRRRAFLFNLAALAGHTGFDAGDPIIAIESIRHGLIRSLAEERETADVDEWHEIALEYGGSYWTTAPAVLLESLMVDVVGLQAALNRCADNSGVQQELRSVGALLAAFTAQTIANLGSTREALQWWRTARYAADESNDPYTAIWVRGREIVRAGYEHRPTIVIMRLIEDAEHPMRKAPAHALPGLLAGKAQTLALMGRRAEAEMALGDLHERFEALSDSSINYGGAQFPWGEERLHFTDSFVYSHLGDFARAERAQRAALPFYSSHDLRQPAQLELHRALCLVYVGDVAEGIRHARTVISGLPNEHRIVIADLGWDILNAVPKTEQHRTEIVEYRNWLNASSGSQPKELSS
jgi:transcriptional regulator with XRE-family HTH domain